MEFLGRKGLNIGGFVSSFASQQIQKKDEFWQFLSSCLKFLHGMPPNILMKRSMYLVRASDFEGSPSLVLWMNISMVELRFNTDLKQYHPNKIQHCFQHFQNSHIHIHNGWDPQMGYRLNMSSLVGNDLGWGGWATISGDMDTEISRFTRASTFMGRSGHNGFAKNCHNVSAVFWKCLMNYVFLICLCSVGSSFALHIKLQTKYGSCDHVFEGRLWMVLNATHMRKSSTVPVMYMSPCLWEIFVRKSLASWVKCRETVTIGSMFSFVVGICEFN